MVLPVGDVCPCPTGISHATDHQISAEGSETEQQQQRAENEPLREEAQKVAQLRRRFRDRQRRLINSLEHLDNLRNGMLPSDLMDSAAVEKRPRPASSPRSCQEVDSGFSEQANFHSVFTSASSSSSSELMATTTMSPLSSSAAAAATATSRTVTITTTSSTPSATAPPFSLYCNENNNSIKPFSRQRRRLAERDRRGSDPNRITQPWKQRYCPSYALEEAKNKFASLPDRLDTDVVSLNLSLLSLSTEHARLPSRERRRSQSVSHSKVNSDAVFSAADLTFGDILGMGAFGQAIKVIEKTTCKPMVMKRLYRMDSEAEKSFANEVSLLRKLDHPNVLKVLGVIYEKGRINPVVEFIKGGTLKDLIHDERDPFPWLQRVRCARDISAGMEYLHSNNIMHRDLNSQNCLIREDLSVVVADFGLSRIIQACVFQKIRSTTAPRSKPKKRYTVVGNPYFMAPEMLKGRCYNEKVDVYSYGIILCEMIGRIEADPDYLPRDHSFGLNVELFKSKFCPRDCPAKFLEIAIQCCQLDPEIRPQFSDSFVTLVSLECSLKPSMPVLDKFIQKHLSVSKLAEELAHEQHKAALCESTSL